MSYSDLKSEGFSTIMILENIVGKLEMNKLLMQWKKSFLKQKEHLFDMIKHLVFIKKILKIFS